MFLNYGTMASTFLRRGAVLSRHGYVYPFRPTIHKTQTNYCTAKTPIDINAKINDRPLSNEILEVLDSPDKIERDHKHYRYA